MSGHVVMKDNLGASNFVPFLSCNPLKLIKNNYIDSSTSRGTDLSLILSRVKEVGEMKSFSLDTCYEALKRKFHRGNLQSYNIKV